MDFPDCPYSPDSPLYQIPLNESQRSQSSLKGSQTSSVKDSQTLLGNGSQTSGINQPEIIDDNFSENEVETPNREECEDIIPSYQSKLFYDVETQTSQNYFNEAANNIIPQLQVANIENGPYMEEFFELRFIVLNYIEENYNIFMIILNVLTIFVVFWYLLVIIKSHL